MLTDAHLQRLTHEIYAAHYILWNVGIEPENIWLKVTPTIFPDGTRSRLQCSVTAERQGRSFVLPIGPELTRFEGRRVIKAWRKYSKRAALLRTSNEQALRRELLDTEAWRRRLDVLVTLAAKGFELTTGCLN